MCDFFFTKEKQQRSLDLRKTGEKNISFQANHCGHCDIILECGEEEAREVN